MPVARGGRERTRSKPEVRLTREAEIARGTLITTITLGFVSGLAVIAQAMVLARIVDGAAFEGETLHTLSPALVLFAALFVARFGLAWAAEMSGFRASRAVRLVLRRRLVERLFALGPLYAAREQGGDIAATVLDGVDALDPYIARYLPQKMLVGLIPLAILIAVLRLDWMSGVVLLLAAPLIPLFMVLVGSRAEVVNRRQWRELLRMSARFLDAVQGITTLKLFGRARAEIALVRRMTDGYRRTTMESLRIAFLTSAVLEFFASLSIALIAVLFGTRLIDGRADFFPALLVLILIPEFFLPLRTLATHYHARLSALAAAEKIFDVLDEEPRRTSGTARAPHGAIWLACRGVSVTYPSHDHTPGRAALADIDCDIPASRVTAIIGPSGAGKSTLAAALLGFLPPTEGRILVNGTLSLTEIISEEWWRRLAYVPQRPRLFAGTIAANLRLARPSADVAALREAARAARALSFIEALPEGFETQIGEGGTGLSGGQVQRIALARAFLKDAPLLILDEATANLDVETEAELVQTIGRLVAGRTAVLIAHRLATIEMADQVLVLRAGRLVDKRVRSRRARATSGGYATTLDTDLGFAHA